MSTETAAGLSRAMADGSTSSRQVTLTHLARIERLDPLFGAIRSLVPDAVDQAEASDEHRGRHGPRSALEGIPVVVKDNIDVAGQPTTAGAVALASSVATADAPLIRHLREAGAVILAKANLSELANFLTDGMPSGYSSLGGQVLNPYDLAATPSGSSSGTAAAVALEMAPVGIGTETDGSIISPSVRQSLVGIKPTHGLISQDGIVPIAPSQDTAGPMARTVEDAAALLVAMAGPGAVGEASTEGNLGLDALRTWRPEADVLRGAQLVLIRPAPVLGEGAESKRPVGETVISALTTAGAGLTDASVPEIARDDEMYVLHYEFAPAFEAYLRGMGDAAPIGSLAELQAWNNDHAELALKYGQTHVDRAVAIDHDAARREYTDARRRDRDTVTEALKATLGDADALIFRAEEGATWAARSGWPSICVPIGYSRRSRRPLGLTLVARAWSEARLLSLASAIEVACGFRAPPSEVNPAVFVSRRL
ncbi:MAG TPA: amidase family protein [Acidimicrobiales bacterium]